MRAADVIIIVVYMAVLVGVGVRLSRRQHTTDEYFLAKRSVPGWAAGMSLLATIITSVTFIAYPGAAYAGDWSLLVPGIMFVLVIAGIGVVVVPFFRHVVAMSAYEYFGKRFGPTVRMYASFTFAVGHFSKMSFVFCLLALSVGSITGWGLTRIIVILGFITIFYTLIGGLETVIWTAFMFIGSLLWAFYRITGERLPAAVARPDQVFPHFMVTQMPLGVAGLFLAALFGAAMSMLASDLNCLAVVVVEDFYGRYAPRSTDAQRLRLGKVTVAVCGILAIAGALRLSTIRGPALALYYLLTAIVAGDLAGLFLLAFLIPHTGRTVVPIAIAVNFAFTAWATLTMNVGHTWNLHRWNYPWHELTIGAVGNVLVFLAGCLASIVLPARRTTGPTLRDWLAMRRKPSSGPVAPEPTLGETHESLAQSC